MAAVVTVPGGLSPGDSYRLAFVTTGVAPATPSDLAVYDSRVASEAAASPELAVLGTQWRVIGSSATESARSHTATDPTIEIGVPIYNLAGELVAANNSDLWDGSLSHTVGFDPFGAPVTQRVFTGTASTGLAVAGRELGSNGSTTWYGQADLTSGAWTSIDWLGSLSSLHYYAISDTLVVAPEPSAWLLLGLGSLVAAVRRRR